MTLHRKRSSEGHSLGMAMVSSEEVVSIESCLLHVLRLESRSRNVFFGEHVSLFEGRLMPDSSRATLEGDVIIHNRGVMNDRLIHVGIVNDRSIHVHNRSVRLGTRMRWSPGSLCLLHQVLEPIEQFRRMNWLKQKFKIVSAMAGLLNQIKSAGLSGKQNYPALGIDRTHLNRRL